MNNKKRNSRLLIISISSMGITVGVLAGLIAILESVGINHIFKNGGILSLLCLILITICIGLISIIIEHQITKDEIINLNDGFEDKTLDDLLIKIIEKSLKHSLLKEEYNEVIRLGSV